MTRQTSFPSVISLMPGMLGLEQGLSELGSGPVWLVLHGGPGSGVSASLMRPFQGLDPVAVVAPVQLACAPLPWRASQPVTVARQLHALETLRRECGGVSWRVLGGSWGAYLAMAYARAHPEAVDSLVLRGSFVGGSADIWRLLQMIARCFRGQRFGPGGAHLPQSRTRLAPALAGLRKLFQSGAIATLSDSWVQAWLLAETLLAAKGARRAGLEQSVFSPRKAARDLSLSARRRQAAMRMGKKPSRQEVRKVALQCRMLPAALAHPALRGLMPDDRLRGWKILHGRFDRVCSARALGALARGRPNMQFEWVDSGHLAMEPAMHDALVRAVSETV